MNTRTLIFLAAVAITGCSHDSSNTYRPPAVHAIRPSEGGPTHVTDSHGCVDYYSFPGQHLQMQPVKRISDASYEVRPSDSGSELCFIGSDTSVKLQEPGSEGGISEGVAFDAKNGGSGYVVLSTESTRGSTINSARVLVLRPHDYCTIVATKHNYLTSMCTALAAEPPER